MFTTVKKNFCIDTLTENLRLRLDFCDFGWSMSIFSIKGQVVIITGASRGIGRAIAEHFADEGALVYATGTGEKSIEVLKNKKNIIPKILDTGDPKGIKDFFDSIYNEQSKVDTLINNAGLFEYMPASRIKEEHIEKTMNVNFKGVLRMSQTYYNKQRRDGNIINLASVLGLIVAPMAAVYASTKGAIIQLTKSLALEWASKGFRVNAIAPGYIATDMTAKARNDQKMLPKMLNAIPLGRLGEPNDLCGITQFLASQASSYITGSTVVVDGGIIINTG